MASGDVPAALAQQPLQVLASRDQQAPLNIAEIELSVRTRQCLDRRIPDPAALAVKVAAWERDRNADPARVDWRFTSEDARVELKRLYPQT